MGPTVVEQVVDLLEMLLAEQEVVQKSIRFAILQHCDFRLWEQGMAEQTDCLQRAVLCIEQQELAQIRQTPD